MSTDSDLRQKLAAIEHERWADWQKWVHTLHEYNNGMFDTYIQRWKVQIATPYAELSDKEKASDMEQVDRYWPLIEEYVSRTVSERMLAIIGEDEEPGRTMGPGMPSFQRDQLRRQLRAQVVASGIEKEQDNGKDS